MRRRRTPDFISGYIAGATGTGTGGNFSSGRTATGTYFISFPPGFRITAVVPAIAGGTRGFIMVSSVVGQTANILTQNSAGAGADFDFHFTAIGSLI